jgi:DNA polymerase-3 subunit beta
VGISLPDERNLVMFYVGDTVLTSQLLEGRFPDFRSIIPKNYSTSLVVEKTDLLRMCKSVEVFARDSNNSARFGIKPSASASEPGEVKIVGRSSERGDNEGVIIATVEGGEVEVAFNIRYLIDVLNVLPDHRVILESSGPTHPGVLRPEGRDDFLYVVMPMSLGR